MGQEEILDRIQVEGGKPYYLCETKKGIFYVMSSICITKSGFFGELGEGVEKLVINEDITEKPRLGPPLLIEHPESENFGVYLVEGLRNYAFDVGAEYVTAKNFGNKTTAKIINIINEIKYLEVHPRIFIPNS